MDLALTVSSGRSFHSLMVQGIKDSFTCDFTVSGIWQDLELLCLEGLLLEVKLLSNPGVSTCVFTILYNIVRRACCLLSWRVGHCSCFNMSFTELVLWYRLETKRATHLWIISILSMSLEVLGSQMQGLYSSRGRTMAL